jgi:hypothetical protein
MITDVLFDEAMAVVAADDRVGQLDVFDHGLQLAAVEVGELATEDGGDLIGLADGAIGIEQSLAETVQGGTAAEDKIVAVFDLSKEQPMLTAGRAALFLGEEGGKGSEPFLGASQQITAGKGVGQLLQALGIGTF